MERSLKDKLEQNIWITRKCRINASERLLKTAEFIERLNVWYSIVVIILSLISVVTQDDQLSLISLICSIALTVSLFYANAKGFRDRSLALKQNYIELQLLLDELMCTSDTDVITNISRKYADLLKNSENHLQADMDRLRAGSKDEPLAMSRRERARWFLSCVYTIVKRAFFFIWPVVASLLYYMFLR